MRTLILYVFHELTDNATIFLRRGLIRDPNKTFICIYNQPDSMPDLTAVILALLNTYPNAHLYRRPNIGHDFQGWNSALFLPTSALETKVIAQTSLGDAKEEICVAQTSLGDAKEEICAEKPCAVPYLYTLFDRFVFINSTVAGPYRPSYITADWVDCFTSRLSPEVKMTGISINYMGGTYNPEIGSLIRAYYGIKHYDHVHIQSMVFSLDREGLDLLLQYKLFFPQKSFPTDKWTLICTSEVAMSTIFRSKGKSLYVYRMDSGLISPNHLQSTEDIWHNVDTFSLCGPTFPLCETMFVKTNTQKAIFPEKSRYDSV